MSDATTSVLVMGTRGSLLARTQSNHVKEWLESRVPGLRVDVKIVKTEGDLLQETPPAPGERLAKGLFTSALERALRAREIDFAVHSLKDLPVELESGLVVAAIPPREDPRDALLSGGAEFARLAPGSRIATGSPRRQFQLRLARPDIATLDIRGNVDTRIAKLRARECDALVLALSGLRRLGRDGEATEILSYDVMLPAPGQGALAVEMRDGPEAEVVRRALDDAESRACVLAERAVLAGIGGGCQLPLGTLAVVMAGRLHLRAILFAADGSRHARVERSGPLADAMALGRDAAAELGARLGASCEPTSNFSADLLPDSPPDSPPELPPDLPNGGPSP